MTSPASPAAPPSPAAVWTVIQGLTRYWAVAAGVRLGVFGVLAGGPLTAAEVAERCDASPSHLGLLLDGLAASDLLDKAGGRYELTPAARTFLVPGSPRDMSDLVLRSPGIAENWPALAETVRRGGPAHPVEDDAAAFYRPLVTATLATQSAVARATVAAVTPPAGPAPVVLELGAGAAGWTAAWLQALPAATAVVNDLEGVVDAAREHLGDRGLLDRCRLLPGDYRTLPLPEADVVVLAHVCRAEGEDGAGELLRRAVAALRPGGVAVVADYFVDDDGTAPVNAALLGITMMANTRAGTVLRRRACRDWMAAAGLVEVTVLEPIPGNEVMVGRRPLEGGGGGVG